MQFHPAVASTLISVGAAMLILPLIAWINRIELLLKSTPETPSGLILATAAVMILGGFIILVATIYSGLPSSEMSADPSGSTEKSP